MAKKLTRQKAREILHDKEVHGHPLTDKQRRFFGAIAGGAPIKKHESGGWLDKYEDGGSFEGYTTEGRNYSPAWGGQFAHGGEIMNVASPQNPIAQTGKTLSITPDNPLYKYAYATGKLATYDPKQDLYAANLPGVTVTPKPKEKNFFENWGTRIAEESQGTGLGGAMFLAPLNAALSLPQMGATSVLTGSSEARTPSEAMGINNPWLALGVDMVADPANLIGGKFISPRSLMSSGVVGSASRLAAPASLTNHVRKVIEKYPILDEHVQGLYKGLLHDKRTFFEKFPVTPAQRAKVIREQDKAFKEGEDFTRFYFYDPNTGQLRPEIEAKIRAIDPSIPKDYNNFALDQSVLNNPLRLSLHNPNPFTKSKHSLISTRRKDVAKLNLDDSIKQLIQESRGHVIGFQNPATKHVFTFRNQGFYHLPPKAVKQTAGHEMTHVGQELGRRMSFPYDSQLNIFDYTEHPYYYPNPYTDVGKKFADAMVEPNPLYKNMRKEMVDKGIIGPLEDDMSKWPAQLRNAWVESYTWNASPKEIHADLVPIKGQIYEAMLKRGDDPNEAIRRLITVDEDAIADYLLERLELGRTKSFFKPTTTQQAKREIIRILPGAAAVGTVGAAALDNKKTGGIVKDNMGYWNPANRGKAVQIDSKDITMEGVDVPLYAIPASGEPQVMLPGHNYHFKKGPVVELPMAQSGRAVSQQNDKNGAQLEQLTNFTNYNKPSKNWLDKYA